MPLFSSLKRFSEARKTEFDRIPAERRNRLEELARYVRERVNGGQPARLTFVCTHNSRRSQIAQCWAQAAADHHGMPAVETFSGGTEATAFNPRAVETLRRVGFEIARESEEGNPVYLVRYGESASVIRAFSKIYDQAPNPTEEFCSVMTCAAADTNCPVVPGASMRVAIPYDDPGEADGTRREEAAYDRCCLRIGREMLYLFSRVDS